MRSERCSTAPPRTSCSSARINPPGPGQDQRLCELIKDEDQESEAILERFGVSTARNQESVPAVPSTPASEAAEGIRQHIDLYAPPQPQLQSGVMNRATSKSTSIRTNIATFRFESKFDRDTARAHILEFSKKLLGEECITKLHDRMREVSEDYLDMIKGEAKEMNCHVPRWMSSILDSLQRERSAALTAIGGIILVQINTQNARYGEWYKQQRRRTAGGSPHPAASRKEAHCHSSELLTARKRPVRPGRASPENDWTPFNTPPRKRARRRPHRYSVSTPDSVATASTGSSVLASTSTAPTSATLVNATADSVPEKIADYSQDSTPAVHSVPDKTTAPNQIAPPAPSATQALAPALAPAIDSFITPTSAPAIQLRAQVYFDTKLYPVTEVEASKKLRRIVSTVDGFLRQVEATINEGVSSAEMAKQQADWLRDAVATDLQ